MRNGASVSESADAGPNCPLWIASQYAWGRKPDQTEFPYYFRWFFRTGSFGDFEYLVRLLKALRQLMHIKITIPLSTRQGSSR